MQRVVLSGFSSEMIKRILLAFVAFFVSVSSFAAAPIYTWGMDQAYGFFPMTNRAESPGGLCSDFAAARNKVDTVNISSCSGQVQGPSTLYITRTDVPGTIINYGIKRYAKCYDGSEPLSGKPEAEQCGTAPPPPPAKCPIPAGTTFTFSGWGGTGPIGSSDTTPGTDPGWPKSAKGCNIETIDTVDACYSIPSGDGKTKKYYCVYTGTSAGTVAPTTTDPVPPDGAPSGSGVPSPPPREPIPPKPAPPNSSCPKGSVNAGMSSSGIPMCVGTGTTPQNSPAAPPVNVTKSTTTNADGSTTTTTNTVTTNADGSKTTVTDKVTVAASGGGTTTEQTKATSTTPSGAAGTETKPQDVNFCKQNPTLSICRESSVSGTCGQISCMGDAIQCATLRAAAAMQCAQKADEDAMKARPEVALGNSILAGADPMKGDIDAMLKGTEVDLSKPSLDQAGFLGGGSCLANRSFTVMGKSVPVNFTQLCTNIQPLRAVVMALAFLTAYLLVSRSVLQS